MNDVRDDFLDLVQCAREIVLPGATGPILPRQRPVSAYYDVSRDCIDLTEGMPAYGA